MSPRPDSAAGAGLPPERWARGRAAPAGADIVDLVAERTAAGPEAVAVVCDGERLTYGELERRATALSGHLVEQGVGGGTPVGLCLDRSLDHVVGLMAVLRAGGAYVPLDPEAPTERIRYVRDDAGLALVVAHQTLAPKVRGSATAVTLLDRRPGRSDARSPLGPPPLRASRAQAAYVLYTSGSTGRPKGVVVERGPFSDHCRAMVGEYGLETTDRVLQFSQYSADASLEQILPTLAAGGRLVMRGPEIWTADQLLETLVAEQVTVANFSPAYWQQVVREWTRTSADLTGLRLRLVILGGERVSAHAVGQWRNLGLDGVRLRNGYGPTEAIVTATMGEAGEEEGTITIGRPLPGRQVRILDHQRRPVAVGTEGELYIGGPLLARGYLGRPELTGERFVADPFSTSPGGRLYRTGDMARFLDDGRIEFLGRRDDQVKVRGYRIELGEVEAALADHPSVDEVVVAVQGEDDDTQLVAYVVTRPPFDETPLRHHLEARLPRHMYPAAIVPVAAIPRLATGKPDRRSLPAVVTERADRSTYVAPRRAAERKLVEIWEQLLEPRPIGVRDNFFHLGGHSLLAAQLVVRIEQAFGVKLALSTLFAHPTIEQQAEVLESGEEQEGSGAPVLAVQSEGTAPPLFFLHGDWTGGAFYCFALARAGGPDQPFYALAPYRFRATEPVPTLEAIAAAHLAAVRKVQARGPYRLGGFCNGGLLAYEMARQLESEGEDVEFLGLVNPSEPVQPSAVRSICAVMGRLAGVDRPRRADLYLTVRHALRHLYRRLQPHGARVQDFGQLEEIEPRLARMFPPREALYRDYVGVLSWSSAVYRAGHYGGPVTFFWARDEPEIARTWWPVVRHADPGDIEDHVVPGTHLSCVTEGITELAAALASSLRRPPARRRHRDRPEPRPFRIRPLRPADAATVAGLEWRAFPDDPWTTATAGGRLAPIRTDRSPRLVGGLARLVVASRISALLTMVRMLRLTVLGRPDSLSYLVAEIDGQVVGYCCLDTVPGRTADLQMMAVQPDRRGLGIGSAFMAAMMDLASARGCPTASLYVRADNPAAHALYERLGFRDVARLTGYYRPSETDAVIMEADLRPAPR